MRRNLAEIQEVVLVALREAADDYRRSRNGAFVPFAENRIRAAFADYERWLSKTTRSALESSGRRLDEPSLDVAALRRGCFASLPHPL